MANKAPVLTGLDPDHHVASLWQVPEAKENVTLLIGNWVTEYGYG